MLAGYRGPVREAEIRAIVDSGGDVETHRSMKNLRGDVIKVGHLAGQP